MKKNSSFGRILLCVMLTVCLGALSGCGVTRLSAGNEVIRVEGGWLISDASMYELMSCCEFCPDVSTYDETGRE